MLSMGVCATRHWQSSGGLVRELNICTVNVLKYQPTFFQTGSVVPLDEIFDENFTVTGVV